MRTNAYQTPATSIVCRGSSSFHRVTYNGHEDRDITQRTFTHPWFSLQLANCIEIALFNLIWILCTCHNPDSVIHVYAMNRPATYRLFTLHWRHNWRDCASNHQHHDCVLNRLFRRRLKKTSKLRVIGLCAVSSPGPVNSPHKWPVTRKMFPFDDVIMTFFYAGVPHLQLLS